jgi:hypothetical protein
LNIPHSLPCVYCSLLPSHNKESVFPKRRFVICLGQEVGSLQIRRDPIDADPSGWHSSPEPEVGVVAVDVLGGGHLWDGRQDNDSNFVGDPTMHLGLGHLDAEPLPLQLIQQARPSDKKNKRIESREIRDSDSGSSLDAYIEGIFVSSMEQMGIFGVQERSLIEQIA